MTSNTGRTPIAVLPKRGVHYPTTKTASNLPTAPPVIIAGAPILQTLGVYSGSFTIKVPALAAGQVYEVTQQVSLTTFPSPFTLQKGATGQVTASIFLQNPPLQAPTIVSVSALSLFFKNGLQTGPGTGTWTVKSGVTYSGPTLLASFRVTAQTPTEAQDIVFVTHAQLVGIPA